MVTALITHIKGGSGELYVADMAVFLDWENNLRWKKLKFLTVSTRLI